MSRDRDMTTPERVMFEEIVRVALAGADLAEILKGNVKVKVDTIICPYCEARFETLDDASKHDAECQKHPMAAKVTVLAGALAKIIEMNRQHARDEFGDAEKAEGWACVKVARAALKQAEVQP
jgi:Zn-finger nucleic acid-binding protein